LPKGAARAFLRAQPQHEDGPAFRWTYPHTTMSDNAINLKDFQVHDKDTGSASYQAALLTQRILHLTAHLGIHSKDFSSRRGLLKLVAQRRKMLDYLKSENEESYTKVVQGLGLRR
jgi:small subunit ribosomal protein S15